MYINVYINKSYRIFFGSFVYIKNENKKTKKTIKKTKKQKKKSSKVYSISF